MAKAALELTEASRMKRIHGCATNDWEHLDDDASHLTHPSVDEAELNRAARATGDEECIEVQHIGPSRSFVLGCNHSLFWLVSDHGQKGQQQRHIVKSFRHANHSEKTRRRTSGNWPN